VPSERITVNVLGEWSESAREFQIFGPNAHKEWQTKFM